MVHAAVLLVVSLPIAAPAAEPPFHASCEAESIPDAVGAEGEDAHAADASGGKYVYLAGGTKTPQEKLAGHLKWTVEAPAGGYLLRVRVLALNGGSDSFWVIVDGGSPQNVSVPASKKWEWRECRVRFLAGKKHTIILAAREPTRVDALELASAATRPTLLQATLVDPEPDDRLPVFINPPTLRWPRFADGPYVVEMSRRKDLANPIRFESIGETFYRPLKPLEPGRWWWHVGTQEGGLWLNAVSFDLPEEVTRWEIPPWDEALGRVPEGHPRLWMRPEDLPRFRQTVRNDMKDDLARWTRRAQKAVGAKLPEPPELPKMDTARQQSTVRRVSSKGYANRLTGPIGPLAFLYLLTGRQEFADAAKLRALAAADLDPNGFTSHKISDFANAAIVRNCAYAYDYLYDVLAEAERAKLREAILARCRIGFARYMPRQEQRLFGAHAWQHVIQDLTAGALAIYDESEEARKWFAWSLKMHVALHPWYGRGDGGSAEGAGYYEGTNMLTSLRAAALFQSATGIDLMQGPWYRNNPYFLIYSHPPGFPRSQFADHSERISLPGGAQKLAAMLQSARLKNPYARAYADAIERGLPGLMMDEMRLLWGPLDLPEPKPLSSLPKARAFYDVGVVIMHSAIDRPDENIMFEFRSSPYGSYNHAHADQNSFNITAYGEPLIVDSGYYTSYGDPHHYGWTIRTKAHNTILVDGVGQAARNVDAYGQIEDFRVGDGFAYALGSCPNAYHEVKVDRFDREVLWIEPDTYVIRDRLSTPEPHRFQWLMHAANEMEVREQQRVLSVRGEKAEARVTFLAPDALQFSQTDQFDPPPVAWRPDRKSRKYPNQWHLTASTVQPSTKMEFLTVVQVCPAGQTADLPAVTVTVDGDKATVRVSDGRTGTLPPGE